MRARADMPWAFLLVVAVFAIGVIVLRSIAEPASMLVDVTAPHAEGSEAATKGLASAETAFNLWPVWFLGVLLVFLWSESVRKSEVR